MKRKIFFTALLLVSFVAQAGEGLVTVTSKHDAKTTADRLVAKLKEKGMTIFIRVDHTAGAAGVGIKMRPTEVVIFGNPKLGSLLMNCAQTTGIDLPMKALIFETESGEVKLSYNDPAYLVSRHHIKGCEKPLAKITGALANFAMAATQ